MNWALSTRWNATRHTSGRKLIEEILDLGFSCVELGYDLRVDLVPGVMEMFKSNSVQIVSLHNFCPLPVGAVRAHPEIYTFTDDDPRMRECAIEHTIRTIRFAAEVGAKTVIAHAGHVPGIHYSRDLIALCEQSSRYTPEYETRLQKLRTARDRKAPVYINYLTACLDRLLPELANCGVTLALELLPTWEAVPTELEIENLMRQYNSPYVRCWYDVGHAQIRSNLGFVNSDRWRDRLEPWIAGFHLHDVNFPAQDHLMPPQGQVDFAPLKRLAESGRPLIFEPAPNTPSELVLGGKHFLDKIWGSSNMHTDKEIMQ